ncbi:MAG: glycosyltransferase [Pseudomonadales bacterium]|nr:glycosyltransferase [Pseudomonadales bacterium]
MEYLLIICIIGVIYSYALYPLILAFVPKRHLLATAASHDFVPTVDLIITAHNEASRIQEKIENALLLDYPRDKLTIIVASDGSTDATNAIVESYTHRGVQLVDVTEHDGKEHAQLCAIKASHNELIVFSDVATQMQADALQNLVALFSDTPVGAVSSEDRFISDSGDIAGEGLYVKYEMWLRQLESERAGLIGLSGSFFAARRDICDQWDTRSPSDFNTALRCNAHGKIAISSDRVLGFYKDLKDPQKEYNRKVRTVLRGITALMRHLDSLNVFKHGLFAFQVWSHKVMRWLVPWFLLSTALLSIALCAQHWFYALLCLGQLVFYGIAFFAWKIETLRNNGLARIIFFFVQVNISIAHATVKYITGTRMTVWSPSQR